MTVRLQRPLRGLSPARLRVAAVLVASGLGGCPTEMQRSEDQGDGRPGSPPQEEPAPGEVGTVVRGMTISCQTNGREWGTAGFGQEVERLVKLGGNWVSIHPYARIHGDGRVTWRGFDPSKPPAHITGAIEAAHARGAKILVKPHLAYWGSPFDWRGAITFEGPALETFRATYTGWIKEVAGVAKEADAFCVGTELDRFLGPEHDAFWSGVVRAVRAQTRGHLTYAANWTDFEDVRFWGELDAVGVQAYFPLVGAVGAPTDAAALRRGWAPWVERLRAVHERTGKPVIFTELGYDQAEHAALEPWRGRPWRGRQAQGSEAGCALQLACLESAFEVLEAERRWLRGAFLWKWFVGPSGREDFPLDTELGRALLSRRWRAR